jgi:hypothetical protein
MSESRIGKIFSDETKKILSELRTGKDSPFLNKSHTEETKQKMSEALCSKVEVFNKETNETVIYPSNYKAAEAIGCSEFTVRYYIKNKKLYKSKYLFKKNDESVESAILMSQEMREQLRKQRGTPIFVYDANDFSLLYVFASKTYMFNTIGIHHNTFDDCLDYGKLYLDTFFFSLDKIEESTNTNLLTLDEIKILVSKKREIYKVKHPASKAILAEFKDDPNLNKEFSSLSSLAKELKGDRAVIREYLKGTKTGYYRGK